MRIKLQEGEYVIYIAKKHWIVYLIWLVVSLIIVVGAYALKYTLWGVAVSALYLLYVHLERKTNLWIVTDKRFIDEYGIVSLYSKETPIDKINNVTFGKDILGRIFGYGDVMIQSAAELGMTKAKFISQPEMLKAAIEEAQRLYATRQLVPPDSMQCPVCKEIIKKGALICRFCGFKLDSQDIPQVAENQPETVTASSPLVDSRLNVQSSKEDEDKVKHHTTETFERRGKVWRP